MGDMLKQFPTEKVVLKKPAGERFDDVEALFGSATVFIDNPSLPVEEGDIIIRNLENGLTESYEVVDRGYHRGMGGIPSHYQISVRKITGHANSHASSSYSINNVYLGDGASGVQIQQGSRGSAQHQSNLNAGFDYDACADVIAQIKEYAHSFDSVFGEQAEEARCALDDADMAIIQKDSRATKEALERLKSLAGNVGGNLIATGIVQLLSSLPAILM